MYCAPCVSSGTLKIKIGKPNNLKVLGSNKIKRPKQYSQNQSHLREENLSYNILKTHSIQHTYSMRLSIYYLITNDNFSNKATHAIRVI
jgi:uncharacterized lipoprotein YddW (UPF0748 family)